MEHLTAFASARDVNGSVRLGVAATTRGVPSWNTRAEHAEIAFRLLRDERVTTPWIELAWWAAGEARSYSRRVDSVHVEIDTIVSDDAFDAIELDAGEGIELQRISFATPVAQAPSSRFEADAVILDVPARSQYVGDDGRGWCSPASLSMIHAYFGVDRSVEKTAAAVLDHGYHGTGNWSFNVAYSGSLGLTASVAYLRNLDHAQRFIERDIPLALSYAWNEGELPGAPIPKSDGHLAVLCGFTHDGDCAVNDPAAPGVRVVYPRATFEALWQRHGGIAYIIAPSEIEFDTLLTAAQR
jgi:hypothetical protein